MKVWVPLSVRTIILYACNPLHYYGGECKEVLVYQVTHF